MTRFGFGGKSNYLSSVCKSKGCWTVGVLSTYLLTFLVKLDTNLLFWARLRNILRNEARVFFFIFAGSWKFGDQLDIFGTAQNLLFQVFWVFVEMARTSRYSSNTLDSPVCLSCKISNVQQLYLISNAQIFWVTSLPLKCSMFSDRHLFQRIAVTKRPVTGVKKDGRSVGKGFYGRAAVRSAPSLLLALFLIAGLANQISTPISSLWTFASSLSSSASSILVS